MLNNSTPVMNPIVFSTFKRQNTSIIKSWYESIERKSTKCGRANVLGNTSNTL